MHIHVDQRGESVVEPVLDPAMRGYNTLLEHQKNLDQRCDSSSLKGQITKNNRAG